MSKKLIKIGKFLSFVLRHNPGAINLVLDANGWAEIDELIHKAGLQGTHFDFELIAEVVAKNEKKRFILSDNKKKIRANQGHSIKVDLELATIQPPETLYHGTARRFLASIMEQGLISGSRLHVHLSSDQKTARNVGSRHGKPEILKVQALEMYQDGYSFYLSANQVWLSHAIPVKYLEKLLSC